MIWGRTIDDQLWMYKRHQWFAWYPCTLYNGRWVWLQKVWRQKFCGWDDYYKREEM